MSGMLVLKIYFEFLNGFHSKVESLMLKKVLINVPTIIAIAVVAEAFKNNLLKVLQSSHRIFGKY